MYVNVLIVIITALALDYVVPQRMGPPPTDIPLKFCIDMDHCTLPLEYCHLFCRPMERATRSFCTETGGNCRRYRTYGDRCSNLTPLCVPPLTCKTSSSVFYNTYNIGTCQNKRCYIDEECGPKEECVHNSGEVEFGICVLEDTSTMKPATSARKCKWTCTD